ncbi:MAG: DUF3267 domain-containing protein [Clostridiales bacterium]|nr:DUF3267 domain-containing protein [Clostridiales bacterium]
MMKCYDYKSALRLNMLDPKLRLLHKLNTFAVLAILFGSAAGLLLNYCLRMIGAAGGMYFVYALCGFALCLIYPYVHEFAHAFAVIIIKRQVPNVKFGKLAAYCGSPDIVFSKMQYYFVAAFPFVFYCLILIPLCVIIPAMYFPLPFMPLIYNVFGSAADAFMIRIAVKTPKGSIIVDSGTEIVTYIPLKIEQKS